MARSEPFEWTLWVCPKKNCDYQISQPAAAEDVSHLCGAGKRQTFLVKEGSEGGVPEKKRVASQSQPQANESREEPNMATKRAAPKAAEKKAPAKKAAAKKAPAEKVEKAEGDNSRRVFGNRGWLAEAVDAFCRSHDAPISVSTIASSITNSEGENPSSGAVAACIKRWDEGGYIKTTSSPLSFNGFMAKWKSKTLQDFLDHQKAAKQAERAAAKAAKAAASA